MEIPLQTKVEVIRHAEKYGNKADTARKFDISRKTVTNWCKDKEAIMEAYESQIVNPSPLEVLPSANESLEVVHQKVGEYLERLLSLDDLEQRKRVYVAGVEKVMWDFLDLLDRSDKTKMRPNDIIKAMKEANEVREKLAGEPSVIIEYRAKFQVDVLKVLQDIAPDIIEEFVTRMEMLEEAEFSEI